MLPLTGLAPRLVVLLLCGPAAALAPTPPRGVGTRTVGVDFGLRRTGLALSSGFSPMPVAVVSSDGSADDFPRVAERVVQLAAAEGATQIVVGIPLNATGGEGEQAEVTRVFATLLAARAAPRPVFLWDERFSSAEASIRMHQGSGAAPGEALDAVAAAVILESFFDDAAGLERAELVAPPAGDEGRQPAPPSPPPPKPLSHSEVQRRMREKAAAQSRAAVLGSGRARRKRR